MKSLLMKIVDIFVAVTVLFLLPAIYFGQKQDAIIQLLNQEKTSDLVNTVAMNGYISKDLYEAYISELDSTGIVYDVALEQKELVLEPEYRLKTVDEILGEYDTSWGGENIYHNTSVHTSIPSVYDPINNAGLNTETNESVIANAINKPESNSHIHGDTCYTGEKHVHSGDSIYGGGCYQFYWPTNNTCMERITNVVYLGRHSEVDYWYRYRITCPVHGTSIVTTYSGKYDAPEVGEFCDIWISKEYFRLSCGKTEGVYYTNSEVHEHNGDVTSGGDCYSANPSLYCRQCGGRVYFSHYSWVSNGSGDAKIYTCVNNSNHTFALPTSGTWFSDTYHSSNGVVELYDLTCTESTYHVHGGLNSYGGCYSDTPIYYCPTCGNPQVFSTTGYYAGWEVEVWIDYRCTEFRCKNNHTYISKYVAPEYPLSCGKTEQLPKKAYQGLICSLSIVSVTPTHNTQTVYLNDELITTMTAVYIDGSTKVIVADADFTTNTIVSNKTVKLSYHNIVGGINYGSYTGSIQVTVIPRNKTCIRGHTYNLLSDSSDPGCPYCKSWLETLKLYSTTGTISLFRGTTLEQNEVIVLATYLDGRKEYLTTGYVDNLDKYYVGAQTVTIGYKGLTTTCSVIVKRNIIRCDVCGKTYELLPDDSNPGCPYCASLIPVFTGNVMQYYTINTKDEILRELYEGRGIYFFNAGDIFTLEFHNKTNSVGMNLVDFLYVTNLPNQLQGTYGSMIRRTGSPLIDN